MLRFYKDHWEPFVARGHRVDRCALVYLLHLKGWFSERHRRGKAETIHLLFKLRSQSSIPIDFKRPVWICRSNTRPEIKQLSKVLLEVIASHSYNLVRGTGRSLIRHEGQRIRNHPNIW